MKVVKKDVVQVLCLFDYKATTGFATVSRHVVAELERRFGDRLFLDIVAINYFNELPEVIQESDQVRVITVARTEQQQDPFCRLTFLRLLNGHQYDGYFIIQDPSIVIGMLPNLIEVNQNKHQAGMKRPKSLFYFPVDSTPLNHFFRREDDEIVRQFDKERLGGATQRLPKEKKSLGYLDRLVTYTDYGRREILKKAPWLKDKLGVIPHGIDPAEFFVMAAEEKEAFRKQYFGENAHKYLFINVNRNQFRKDIPRTIKAFALWQRINTTVRGFLYLHMNPNDPMGWDLRTVADQLDLVEGEDYGFPPEDVQDAGSDIATLRGIYNAADCYVTTTTGEGWGLTIIEAMACGCPVIAPDHTSISEIGQTNTAFQRDPLGIRYYTRILHVAADLDYCDLSDSVWRKAVNPEDVAFKMDAVVRYLRNHSTLHQIEEGLKYTKELTWKRIGELWAEEFEKLFF